MTVKECAVELAISPALVLELLRHGLLPGSKKGRTWRVDGDDLSAVRGALASLRGASQPDYDPHCWSWLHEPDAHDLTPPQSEARPWSAPMAPNAGGWLGRNDPNAPEPEGSHGLGSLPAFVAEAHHDPDAPPPLTAAEEAMQRARSAPHRAAAAPPRPAGRPESAPLCPRCGELTSSRLVDADLGEQWFCAGCDAYLERLPGQSAENYRGAGWMQHAADYDTTRR